MCLRMCFTGVVNSAAPRLRLQFAVREFKIASSRSGKPFRPLKVSPRWVGNGATERSKMSFSCHFGFHRPFFNSIMQREHGLTAVCDNCTAPPEQATRGGWKACAPFAQQQERLG